VPAKPHPVDSLRWLPVDQVRSNDYNPNSQVAASHELLIESIRLDGWTQPVVVRPPDAAGMHVIVDGEHRWKAAKAMGSKTLPVVILDKDEAGCIAATVRHNRARGTHGVEHMAHVIARMRAEKCTSEQIEAFLGMTAAERQRLETTESMFLAIAGGRDESMSTG